MSEHEFLCESCGQRLSGPDAVCPVCEAQLEREIALAAEGAYRCPECSKRFDQPHFEPWPRGAKWYTPRQVKPICPHCRTFLWDRENPRLPATFIWILAASSLVAYFMVPSGYEKPLIAGLLGIYCVALIRYRWRYKDDSSERFARDEG